MAFTRIGALTRRLRRAQGLTLRELAGRTGVNHVSLHRIEDGDQYLASNFGVLALVLGPELTELLREETDLRHALDRLAADAEQAASGIAAEATPAFGQWTNAPGALSDEEIRAKLTADREAVPWADLLTPAALATQLRLEDPDPEQVAVLQKACDRWIQYMT